MAAVDSPNAACPVASSRVALLLRGYAFRPPPVLQQGAAGTGGCSDLASAHAEQLEATQSLLAHIIEPLEACANTVEIIATECSRRTGCPLLAPLFASLGAHRFVTNLTACATPGGQPSSVRLTLDTFRAAALESSTSGQLASTATNDTSLMASRAIAERYSLVLVTRHDLIFRAPITQWSGLNASRFNFFGGCEPRCAGCKNGCAHCPKPEGKPHIGTRWGGGPETCVQDAVHAFPGTLFTIFDWYVARRHVGCFESVRVNKGTGHQCWRPISTALRGEVAFMLPYTTWRPNFDVREPNPYFRYAFSRSSTRAAKVPLAPSSPPGPSSPPMATLPSSPPALAITAVTPANGEIVATGSHVGSITPSTRCQLPPADASAPTALVSNLVCASYTMPRVATCLVGGARTLNAPLVYRTVRANLVEAFGGIPTVFAVCVHELPHFPP